MFEAVKRTWFFNVRADVLSGMVVALALIPESLAFAAIAGVDPKVGLYASFCIAVVIAFSGGRPAMISAATGAMSLLMVTLVKEHGLQYLLAASVLCGLLQIIAGYLRLGSLLRFVSRAVMTGFVNSLAILVFLAQLPQLIVVSWHVYALTAAGIALIYAFPYVPVIGRLVPSALVSILLLTALSMYWALDVRTVGDMGELPSSLPIFLWPDVPLTLETLGIILPYSLALAVVGLLESLLTATILDDMTDTPSDKNRECKGQGIANIVAGLMGGMAGCAMIGQSVINVKSGGRGRLSTLVAGVVLLLLVLFFSEWVKHIPMAALVAVMLVICVSAFDWHFFHDLRRYPLPTNLVTIVTMTVVVWTHNLAYGVFAGVLLAALFFAHKISRLLSIEREESGETCRYFIEGQVFFASAERFMEQVAVHSATTNNVVIDVSRAHFWDITAVAALDKAVLRWRNAGANVTVVGLNLASATLVERFGVYDKSEATLNLHE